MEANCSKLTERILQLTLEIIYLLTGEDNIVVWKPSGDGQKSILVPLSSLTIPERNNNKRILEINQKIMELLTGEAVEAIHIKTEVKEEEETYVKENHQCKKEAEMTVTKEESSLHVSTGTHEAWNTPEEHLISPPDYNGQNNGQPSFPSMDAASEPSQPKETSCDNSNITQREKLFSCTFHNCEKSFTKKSSLVLHQRTHTSERPFSCSECKKIFLKKSELVQHLRIHTGEKPFSCSECEKSYTCKRQLRTHQRVHTGVKNPFACSECERSFGQKADLIRHVRIHTGEKPFSCSECGKSFTDKSLRNRHLRVHTGEKPFSCSECGKCFSVKGSRDAHMHIHTGEKPFSCLKCGQCFTHKKALYLHRKKHTD